MNKRRNTQVDGLRALAILMVVFFHLFIQYRNLYDDSFTRVAGVNLSTVGTSIFLILSGCFIVNSKKENGFWRNMLKRIIRLYPVYLSSIIITFLLTHLIWLPGRTVSLFDFLLNTIFINGYIKVPYVDGAHWYITTLLSSSAVYYATCRLKNQHMYLLLWGIVVFILQFLYNYIPVGLGTKITSFVLLVLGSKWSLLFILGVYIRGCLSSSSSKELLKINKIAPPILIIIMMSLSMEGQETEMLTVSLLCILLVCLALKEKLIVLQSKMFVYLGLASYSIYCIHQNVGFVIISKLESYIGNYEWWMSMIAIILMIGFGALIYVFVEKNMGKYLKRFVK
jgi:peptidoglycan/LPS O-acetylase OafA/YrhL